MKRIRFFLPQTLDSILCRDAGLCVQKQASASKPAPEPGALQKLASRTTEHPVGTQAPASKNSLCVQTGPRALGPTETCISNDRTPCRDAGLCLQTGPRAWGPTETCISNNRTPCRDAGLCVQKQPLRPNRPQSLGPYRSLSIYPQIFLT
jgi:hypothetical protein